MSMKWKRGFFLGVIIFLYSLAAQNFWPDLNIYLNALIVAIVGVMSAKIFELVFKEER